MNQREIAKTKMYPALYIFLTDPLNAIIIANDNPFKAAVIEYGAKLLVVNNCAIPLSIDNTVYSQAKTDAKGKMADEAAALSGRALVALNKLNKTTEAGQLHIFASDYMHLSDPEAIALGQSTHDLLAGAAIFPFISPDYVTAQNLLDYQGLVTTYSGTQGTSAAVHAGSPEDLKNFKKAILAIDGIIADMFLLAASYKKEATSAFYSAFVAQAAIPAVHVAHTSMSLLVKPKLRNRKKYLIWFKISNA